jgi:hypothetical protein
MIPLGTGQMATSIARRQFISALGGVTLAWPLAARTQERERMRRIGVLMNVAAADDALGQARLAAFLQGLQEAGWVVGRNVRIDVRWATPKAAEIRTRRERIDRRGAPVFY